MARRRMTVEDDAEILVHWRAGRGIRQIARSLGRSRIYFAAKFYWGRRPRRGVAQRPAVCDPAPRGELV